MTKNRARASSSGLWRGSWSSPCAACALVVAGGAAIAALARQPQPPLPPGMPARQAAPAEPAADALKALVSLQGPESAFPEERFVRVMDAETFRVMWAMHQGEDPKDNFRSSRAYPEIDFSRCMVIAYFRGPDLNCDGEVIESVTPTPDGIRIRFDSLTYQVASGFGAPEAEKIPASNCRPFGIWVLPRNGGKVLIEENTQGLIGQPAVWTERIHFSEFD